MLKDDNSLFRYIGPILHRCFVQFYSMRINDIRLQSFFYSFNFFFICYSEFIIVYQSLYFFVLLPNPLIFHHSLIHIIEKSNIQPFLTSTSPTLTMCMLPETYYDSFLTLLPTQLDNSLPIS